MALLLLTALAAAATTGAAQGSPGLVLYVAPNGSDTNSGGSPADPLLSVTRAAAAVAAQLSRGLPAGGAEVRILPGRYLFNASGNTLRLGADFRASADRPVVFRGWGVTPTAPAVFDGSAQLDATQLKPITNATVAAVVNPAAAGKLLSMAVPAHLSAVVRAGTEYRPIVEGWSAESMAIGSGSLQWGDTLLTPSTWPNTGLGYVQRVNDKGAVWAVRSHGSSCFPSASARAAAEVTAPARRPAEPRAPSLPAPWPNPSAPTLPSPTAPLASRPATGTLSWRQASKVAASRVTSLPIGTDHSSAKRRRFRPLRSAGSPTTCILDG